MTKPGESLYDSAIAGPYSKFCGGNQGNNSAETCVKIADLAGGGYSLTDSKAEGAGRELRYTEEELVTFARGFLSVRGLTV